MPFLGLSTLFSTLTEFLDPDCVQKCLQFIGPCAAHSVRNMGVSVQCESGCIKPAKLYILDEPTSAMDVNNELKTIRSFLHVTANRSAVIVTHRLLMTKFCDEILVLRDGQIAEIGTHTQLVERGGYYASLYAMQNEGYEL